MRLPLKDEDLSGICLHSFPGFLRLSSGDVPGTSPERSQDCGFRRKSSSCDKAPKVGFSV